MLTDNVINVLQKMLKKQFPDANGLQDPWLGQLLGYQIYQNTPFVQVIIHNGRYHWLALSTYGCKQGDIFVLDSKFNYSLSMQTKKQICTLLHCPLKTIQVTILPVQQQIGGVDCGLFAIVFLQFILSCKQNPMGVSFEQSSMRNHFLKCLKNNRLEMFPQTEHFKKTCKEKVIKLELYCTCRQIWVESNNRVFDK